MKNYSSIMVYKNRLKRILPFLGTILLLNLSYKWAEFRNILNIKEVKILGSSLFNNDYLVGFSADSSNRIGSLNVRHLTSSFITDVKITLKNPDKALPFGEVYSTGSTEWQNWYNNLYSLATTYDEKNIHSLKNNLPTKLIEDTDYENLHTFVNMWGEQFDLIRNYIDNYS